MKKDRGLIQKISIGLAIVLGIAFVAVSFFDVPISSVEVRQAVPLASS